MQDKTRDSLQLINSDERILIVLNETNNYFEQHKEIAESIRERVWIWRSLSSLLPQTVEKFWSGHTFPLIEAEYEIESSVELCKFGFYKHAIAALRNCLELGLLSVYWDIDDQSHINIKQWLNSRESTPFLKSIVFPKLKLNDNIKKFEELHKIFAETSNIYENLCNYQHTKGVRFSSRALSRANYNTFNEPALKAWRNHFTNVTKLIVSFHLLKYPVGLQYTPLEQKFGINGPIGGFLEPHEAERLKILFENNILETLQAISDSDPGARSLSEWINEQPDITDGQLHEQFDNFDKQMIEMQGFERWIEDQKRLYVHLEKTSPAEYAEKLEHFESLRIWAEQNGFMKSKVPPS